MPSWLTPVLQWGGLALAVVSAAALIYVLGVLVPAAEGEAAEPIAAPVTLYWVLLVIGVVGAVIGYVLGRRSPTSGAES
jgi:hypothetical protein